MIAIFPEIVSCAAASDIERLAILVRQYFGQKDKFSPAPDITEVMKNAGIGVQTMPLSDSGALCAKDDKGSFQIAAVVNEGVDKKSQRFLLAHMFGHFLLHVQPLIARGDWKKSGYRESGSPLQRYSLGGAEAGISRDQLKQERLCDDFAAALLMPRSMLKRAMDRFDKEEQAASFFGVTKACLTRRMQQIGLTPQEPPVNFLDAENQIDPAKPSPAKKLDLMEVTKKPKMPRSYSISTYDKTEKSTRSKTKSSESPATAKPKKGVSPKPVVETEEVGLSGMDKLRKLAQKIDTSVGA